jgi:hypothetical protein
MRVRLARKDAIGPYAKVSAFDFKRQL